MLRKLISAMEMEIVLTFLLKLKFCMLINFQDITIEIQLGDKKLFRDNYICCSGTNSILSTMPVVLKNIQCNLKIIHSMQ